MILLDKYIEFLRENLGQSESTIKLRRSYVEKFLLSLKGLNTPSKIGRLKAERVHRYIIKKVSPMGRTGRKHVINSVRSFLRFSYVCGYSPKNLVNIVPVIRTYKLAGVPRGYSWESVQRLLKLPDCRTKKGYQDYALLQLMASYGVRSCQITQLRLQDIHWNSQQIHFRAVKGSKPLSLPLYPEVASALLTYIKKYRPQQLDNVTEIFLTLDGRPFKRQLWKILKRYREQAQIDSPKSGAHAIRHAFATRLLDQQVPFKTISDLLGHKSLSNTFIYTKVDLRQLRLLVREWPQETL